MADPNIKFLTPQKLEVEPGAANAQISFKHWQKTFEHFIARCAANAGRDHPVDKFGMLLNYVSPLVYEYIIDEETFDTAMNALKGLYIKSPSTIYARHQLATHKQQSGESIDKFYRDLICSARTVISKQSLLLDTKRRL